MSRNRKAHLGRHEYHMSGRLCLVLVWTPTGPAVNPRPGLRRLTPAQREELAEHVSQDTARHLSQDEAYAVLFG